MDGSSQPLAMKYDYSGYSIAVFWFSGTGNTQAVTKLLCADLESKGAKVDSFKIEDMIRSYRRSAILLEEYDFIGIGFPVHAFNAPPIVFDFVQRILPAGAGKKVFLYASAGGPTVFNDYSAYRIGRLLSTKDYDVFNSRVFYISANLMVHYGDAAIRQLYERTAELVGFYVDELLQMKPCRLKYRLLPVLVSYICSVEHIGAKKAAKRFFRIDERCTSCGKCVRSCPRDNITLKPIAEAGGRPIFGNDCTLCLRCVYGCPQRSISLVKLKKLLIADRYDVAHILKTGTHTSQIPQKITSDTKGIFFRPLAAYIYGDEKRRNKKIYKNSH